MTEDAADAGSSAAERVPVPDAVRVQILATEHWSLLATRSMTWNEIFSRVGIFLTVLSAAVVSIALVAQATDFGDNFRLFALLVLPVVLLIGVATLIRLIDTLYEDFMLVAAANRLRHAYLTLAPELEIYFTTGATDDFPGVMQSYFRRNAPVGLLQILSSSPMLVGIIDALLAGVLIALIAETLGSATFLFVALGIVTTLLALVWLILFPYRTIGRLRQQHQSRFPSDEPS